MKCRKCGETLTTKNVSVKDIYDNDQLDLMIACPLCFHAINAFVAESDFVDLDLKLD